MNKRIFKPARKLHKWLGYLLGLQIFLWLLGGFVMSAIPLEKVHGKHLANRSLANPFTANDYNASLDAITAALTTIEQITFGHFLDTPVITVQTASKRYLFDGKTGGQFVAPTKVAITKQAQKHLLIAAQPLQTEYLAKGPREVGYKPNIWRVSFDDLFNTTLYLAADSGQVVTVRSTLWRIFDFFWMLHIMDYDEREDFNNPLLISFAATSVLFCITGFILLLQNLRLKRFKRADQLK